MKSGGRDANGGLKNTGIMAQDFGIDESGTEPHQEGYDDNTEGTDYYRMGEIMLQLGAVHAVPMDGGGSGNSRLAFSSR